MKAHIITIGDEILIGQIVDTNSTFISKELLKIGIEVTKIVSIGDSKQEILSSLKNAQNNYDIVIITGGLGPTNDDITKKTWVPVFPREISDPEVKDIKRRQFPIVLAWALTPWKAQGLTLRKATVKLSHAISDPGVLFVAFCTEQSALSKYPAYVLRPCQKPAQNQHSKFHDHGPAGTKYGMDWHCIR